MMLFGPSLPSRLLLVAISVAVAGWIPPVRFVAAEDCPPHGCSLKPVDLASDEQGVAALRILKETGADDSDGGISEERQRALSSLRATGDGTKVTLTMRGYKGGRMEDQINQDRAIVISPFHIAVAGNGGPSSPSPSRQPPRTVAAQLLGIFDGHGDGGELTSQHATVEVPRLLAGKLAAVLDRTRTDDDDDGEAAVAAVVAALKETFLEVDRTDPSEGDGGCTATVVLQLGGRLFVANAGDSVSFVGVLFLDHRNGGGDRTTANSPPAVEIVYQSREDKPDLPEERERIHAAGGYVHVPSDDSDVPRAYHVDENGRLRTGLAMSRSLGDWSVQGVTAEPLVDVLDVAEIVGAALASRAESCRADTEDGADNADDRDQACEALDPRDVHIVAVSASDGMMDYLHPGFVASLLAEAFFDPNGRSQLHPHTAAEHLVRTAAEGWEREYGGEYRDDIAVAAFTVLRE